MIPCQHSEGTCRNCVPDLNDTRILLAKIMYLEHENAELKRERDEANNRVGWMKIEDFDNRADEIIEEDKSWMTLADAICHYDSAVMNWSSMLDERDAISFLLNIERHESVSSYLKKYIKNHNIIVEALQDAGKKWTEYKRRAESAEAKVQQLEMRNSVMADALEVSEKSAKDIIARVESLQERYDDMREAWEHCILVRADLEKKLEKIQKDKAACTGSIVHQEFDPICPVHER